MIIHAIKLYCVHAYKKLVPSIHRLWSKTMELFYVFFSNTPDKSRGINMPFLCELIRSSFIQLQLETSAWSASQNWFRFTFTEHLEQSGYTKVKNLNQWFPSGISWKLSTALCTVLSETTMFLCKSERKRKESTQFQPQVRESYPKSGFVQQ
jgi:hypothetical protein